MPRPRPREEAGSPKKLGPSERVAAIRRVQALRYRRLRYVDLDLGRFHVLIGSNANGGPEQVRRGLGQLQSGDRAATRQGVGYR